MKKHLAITLLSAAMSIAALPVAYAQMSPTDAIALIQTMVNNNAPTEQVVQALVQSGITLEEALELLATLTNNTTPTEVIGALIDAGMMPQDAAVELVSLHTAEAGQIKTEKLMDEGITLETAARLAVVLTTKPTTMERIDTLMQMGMTLKQSADYLVVLTVAAKPVDLIDAVVSAGLPITQAASVVAANINYTRTQPQEVIIAMVDRGITQEQAQNIMLTSQVTGAGTTGGNAQVAQNLNTPTETTQTNDPNALQQQQQTQQQLAQQQPLQTQAPVTFSNNILTGSATGGGVSNAQ